MFYKAGASFLEHGLPGERDILLRQVLQFILQKMLFILLPHNGGTTDVSHHEGGKGGRFTAFQPPSIRGYEEDLLQDAKAEPVDEGYPTDPVALAGAS